MISKQFHDDNVWLGNLVGGGDLIYRGQMALKHAAARFYQKKTL